MKHFDYSLNIANNSFSWLGDEISKKRKTKIPNTPQTKTASNAKSQKT